MKIKFFSNYTTSENLLKRFKANYRIEDDQVGFTINNDYDFAVVFNRTEDFIKPDAKIITIVQEPSWSDAYGFERKFLQSSDFIILHDPSLIAWNNQVRLGGKVIVSPSYLFFNDEIDKAFFEDNILFKKEKKISVIMSSLQLRPGNYKKRLQLLVQILKSDLDIDIYGRGLNIDDPRYKGELEYKFQGLLPYEYSIAIENCNERNYITEKFVDCVLCHTIPIYNGAPNITEVYDGKYIKKIDLDSPTVIEDIKRIIAEPAPLSTVNKEIYFSKLNLYTKLKEIIYADIRECKGYSNTV